MARVAARGSLQQVQLLPVLRQECPSCGELMHWRYENRRTVVMLGGMLGLRMRISRCENVSCNRYHKPYRPEAEGTLVLPQHEFGLDVVALVGALRYQEHRSVPEIHAVLLSRGVSICERSVTNLVDRYDELLATALGDSARLRKELAAQGLSPTAPNQVWTSDITCIPTDEGWLYLAAVLDLQRRQVVGWSMKPHMQTDLVTDALRMAWFRRQPEPGLVFHSDRGSQYCSHEFQRVLRGYAMRSSMSRKGNCWDNAPTESLWARLKVGRLHGRPFATQHQAMEEVVAWLTFYNYSRLHSSLGYLSPMQYEQRWHAVRHKGVFSRGASLAESTGHARGLNRCGGQASSFCAGSVQRARPTCTSS